MAPTTTASVPTSQPHRGSDYDALLLADQVATQHVAHTEESDRKARGQFFTPPAVAQFMASLFQQIPRECRLLDAGAGVGTLTAAVCDRLFSTDRVSAVNAVAYETDASAVALLEKTLSTCKTNATDADRSFASEIRIWDFITDVIRNSGPLFSESSEPFDLAIMNPPYFKLRADSDHARLAKRIGPSQPNIYSLFMALAVERLRPGGELVAITPRSFCNGRYFRDFRTWLLERTDLLQVHIFGSRKETFREANVLQENIITHFRKREQSGPQSVSIVVSRSFGRDFEEVDRDELPPSRVIDNSCGDSLLCIPDRPEDAQIIELSENWPGRFADTGLRISTGPVVMFRTRDFHADSSNERTVPLLTSHHVRNGCVAWPREKKKWPSSFLDCENSQKHLVPKQNYVIVKRFSAKEERRRLSAGVLCADEFDTQTLAIENHVNYIVHNDRPLTLEEAIGITALFNSALMDRYFRSFSGNTQVNATEVRTMKFPSLNTLRKIGQQIDSDPGDCPETIVMDQLGVEGSARKYLEEFIE